MKFWISSERITVKVETKDGKIVETAPIARKFVGQRAIDLARWLGKVGGRNVRIRRLS